MRVLIVGSSGTIGQAVVEALSSEHEVIEASRNSKVRVDLEDLQSIAKMYETVGSVGAVICTAGQAAFGPMSELTDAQSALGIENKLLGQMRLVDPEWSMSGAVVASS